MYTQRGPSAIQNIYSAVFTYLHIYTRCIPTLTDPTAFLIYTFLQLYMYTCSATHPPSKKAYIQARCSSSPNQPFDYIQLVDSKQTYPCLLAWGRRDGSRTSQWSRNAELSGAPSTERHRFARAKGSQRLPKQSEQSRKGSGWSAWASRLPVSHDEEP